MTREEAIDYLQVMKDDYPSYESVNEALEMAIKALSQEPKADKSKADKLCEVCGYRSGNLCVRPKDYNCRVLSQEGSGI